MRPPRPARTLAALILISMLASCGRSSPPAADQTAAPAPGASGKAAPSTPAPDPGRAVRGDRELVGSWYSDQGKELMGLEFTTSGKIIATLSLGNPLQLGPSVTWDYELLDRGRVRASMPGGETIVFTTGIASGVLTLAPEAEPTQAVRFRRLDRQSVAEAHRADAQRILDRHQAISAEVEALLAQPKLAILPAGDQQQTAREALRLSGGPPAAYLDIEPPVARSAQLAIVDDEPGSPIRIQLVLGEVVGPPGAPQATQAQRELFTVQGDPGSLRVVTDAGRRLVSDAAAFDAIVSRYERVRDERLAAIDAFADPLGAKAILAAERAAGQGVAAETVTLTLERIGQTRDFGGTLTDSAGRSQPILAGATWSEGARGPILVVRVAGNTEQWIVTPSDAGTIAGNWQRGNARGGLSLAVTRAWTAEQLAAHRAAIERFLNTDLQSPLEFAGFVSGKIANAEGRWPIWLRLQRSGTNISGQAWLHALDGGVELTGTISGGTISLSASRTLDGTGPGFRNYGNQRWQLRLDDIDPQPRFVGELSMPMGGSGSLDLTPASPQRTAAMRDALLTALSAGAAFEMRSSRHTSPREPTFMRLAASADGSLTGELTGNGLDGAYPPALVLGSISEVRGHLLAELIVTTSPSPGGRNRAGHEARFFLVPRLHDGELTLRGRTIDPIFGLFTLVPAADGASPTHAPPPAEQRVRLAAHRAGATHELPRDAAAGDTALVLVQGTTRGQIFFGDGRYRAVNPQVAAVHAGLIADGELALLRVTYAPPHDQAYPVETANGVTTTAIAMNRTTQQSLTMTLEKVDVP